MAHELSQEDLKRFYQKLWKAQEKYNVPGVSATIVQKNRLIFAVGLGVRSLETNEPMTPETVCPLGSMSKSFTALMNATKVDDGDFHWEDTLVANDQWKRMYKFPPGVKKDRLKVYHLMSMSTGLGEPANPYDSVGLYNSIYWNEQSPAHLMKSLATSPIIKDEPGKVFHYNNEIYASAGYLSPLQQKTDPCQMLQAYKNLMYKKVFHPIGLKNTHITSDLSSITDNYAVSYGLQCKNGELTPLEMGCTSMNNINGIAPAGQIVSNAIDLSIYAMTLLNDGVVPSSGHRVVSSENLQELWTPRIDTGGGIPGLTNDVKYGLGWEIDTIPYKDSSFTVYCHGGFLPAWLSWIQLVPDSNVGLAILTNNASGRFLALEMGQELLKLLYGEDLTFDVNVHHYYKQTIHQIKKDQEYPPENPPGDYKVQEDDVARILGNYHGGWTVEVDGSDYLVLSKTGWIYYLYPTKPGKMSQGENKCIIWGSNNSDSLEKGKGSQNKNEVNFCLSSGSDVTMKSVMGEVKRWTV